MIVHVNHTFRYIARCIDPFGVVLISVSLNIIMKFRVQKHDVASEAITVTLDTKIYQGRIHFNMVGYNS